MRRFLAILVLLFPLSLLSQEGVTTLGVQFRPLVPNQFVDFGPVTTEGDRFEATWKPRVSLNFGMVIRYGLTPSFSLESGINLVRRNYTVDMLATDEQIAGSLDFAFTGYEIPIQGLFYVRLGEKLWMNASGGLSIDTYPSHVFNAGSTQRDTTFYDYEQYTARTSWVQLAVQANYGFEWRTKDSGYFYLGATYHQPFSDMALGEAVMAWNDQIRRVYGELSGNYFTIDLRYFFHEDPERKR